MKLTFSIDRRILRRVGGVGWGFVSYCNTKMKTRALVPWLVSHTVGINCLQFQTVFRSQDLCHKVHTSIITVTQIPCKRDVT